jgi:hypothetical protein
MYERIRETMRLQAWKSSLLLAIVAMAMTVCGCGGGPAPVQPPGGNFSNASLKGQYAFLLTGVAAGNGAYAARIGSFTADGAGNITAGVEDALALSSTQGAAINSFSSGTYSISANGRGTVSLQGATSTLTLSVALQSASTGFIAETDMSAATSGSLHVQTPADFSVSALTSQYVFNVSGITFVPSTVAPIAMVGEFGANAAGAITGGLMDTNNGSISTPSGATAIPASSYAMDSSGNAAFGRGTMSLGGYTFTFYIVDSTHLVLLEEDALGGSAGEAFQQSGAIATQNSQFNGSFVYLVSGSTTRGGGSEGPDVRAARFTADGTGGLSAITYDENENGNITHITQGSNATYSIDTANSGSGRGTFSFHNSGNTYSEVFYLISSTQAAVLDISPQIVASGPLAAQSAGPFTLSNVSGNFVFNWTGVQLGTNGAIPFQEDYVGQYTLSNNSGSNIAGTTDYVQLGLSTNSVSTQVPVGGQLTINGDGTANNQYKFAVNGSVSATLNFQAYFVNSSTVYMVTSNGNRTTAGILNLQ